MKVSVIGAGSWGTALAHVLGLGGNDVALWARKQEVCDGVNERHENPRYLIGCKIDSHVKASTSFEEVLSGASAVVIVTPSAVIRQTCANIAPFVNGDTPIVVCCKGVEEGSGLVPVEVLEAELGNASRLAALAGPNHAEEVILGIPAGTVIDCPLFPRAFRH